MRHIPATEIPALGESDLAAALAPRAIRAAKAGMRQLTLFPIDARLLARARDRSIDSISARMERSLALVLEKDVTPTRAARLVIASLAAVICASQASAQGCGDLATWWSSPWRGMATTSRASLNGNFRIRPCLRQYLTSSERASITRQSMPARSTPCMSTSFLTQALRKRRGIFQTDLRFASRILDYLPVEEIPPDERYVVDPACGSGNLLLAAQERLGEPLTGSVVS